MKLVLRSGSALPLFNHGFVNKFFVVNDTHFYQTVQHKSGQIYIPTPFTGRAGNGNDQNFQRGVFSARGGILVFRLRGGIYPPLEKPEVRLLASFRP